MDGAGYRTRLYDMLSREPEKDDAERREGDGADFVPDQPGNGEDAAPLSASDRVGVYTETDEDQEEEDDGKKKKKKKKKKKDEIGSSRGVETLFRTSYTTHMDLSALADNKANIMISINGIIVSVLLASISPKIDANPWLLLPTVMVLVSCLVSLTCAVIAALPRVNNQDDSQEQIRHRRNNILFFGNFTRLPEDEYVQDMTVLLKDIPRMYTSMMRDIYGLGQVLARKFVLLRIAYITFLIGLIVGVVMFVAVYIGLATVPPVDLAVPTVAAPAAPSATPPAATP